MSPWVCCNLKCSKPLQQTVGAPKIPLCLSTCHPFVTRMSVPSTWQETKYSSQAQQKASTYLPESRKRKAASRQIHNPLWIRLHFSSFITFWRKSRFELRYFTYMPIPEITEACQTKLAWISIIPYIHRTNLRLFGDQWWQTRKPI